MSRRLPPWATEVVAWCAALVLLGGGVVVVSGVLDASPPADAAETPALVLPTPMATTPAPATPAPRKTPARAATGLPSVESVLGPPPGPQKDEVPTRFAAPKDRYALLIGITDYPKPTKDTIGSANDVRFIRQSLLAAGWLPQNIRMYTDRQVTGDVTRRGLAWLASRSVPGTFTLFHYSGHVKQTGGHEKLWPADRAFVNDTEVAAILKRGTGRMWVDIAGCEAGGFIEDLPNARTLVTASSTRTQKSYEYPPWGKSVWAGLLFDLGLGQGQADADGNGTTTMGEALRFSTYYAQAITLYQKPHGRQTPQVRGDPVLGWTLANPPA